MEKGEKEKNEKKGGSKSIRLSRSVRTRVLLFLQPSLVFFSIRLVFFPNWLYIILAGAVSFILWIMFSIFDQLLFFTPIFIFYLPDESVTGFILSTIIAILMEIVVSINVYALKHLRALKIKNSLGSFFSGSTLSMISSTCASCSSVGFLLASTFGGIGITASAFLSNYQTYLRVISIALLVWALYSTSNKLTKYCVLNHSLDNGANNS
jgi:hypothetical protein